MAQIVVRNLDEAIKSTLKKRAALKGTSMESEVREILRSALQRRPATARGLGTAIRARFAKADAGFELEALPSAKLRAPVLPD